MIEEDVGEIGSWLGRLGGVGQKQQGSSRIVETSASITQLISTIQPPFALLPFRYPRLIVREYMVEIDLPVHDAHVKYPPII